MTSPVEAQQVALMAQLEVMREEMAREREQIQREREELEARSRDMGAGDDSLQRALREFREQNEHDDPSNRMNQPCAHVNADGATCGLRWKTDGEITHPRTHSYRFAPLKTTDAAKGKLYHPSRADLARYGITETETLSPAEMYVDEKGAAELLEATIPQVRKMVKSGTLQGDQIGTVTLIRKAAVMRIVETKKALAGEGVEA